MLNNKKNKKNKKAFTIVELVIVIAVIAILAAVLIPTFASIIKKANDSAYLQERTNQTIIDSAEEIENPDYLSWKDFEAVLAQLLIERSAELSETEIQNYFKGFDETHLSEGQIKQIIERTLDDEFSAAMVEPIVRASLPSVASPATLSLDDDHVALAAELSETAVKTIVDAAVASLGKEICISADEMKAAIEAAFDANTLDKSKVEPTVTKLSNATLTETEITAIIDAVLNELGQGNDTGDVGGNTDPSNPPQEPDQEIPVEVLLFRSLSGSMPKKRSLDLQQVLTLTPENATEELVWTSSDESVATVENGTVTSKENIGHTVITVATKDGSKTAKFVVVVHYKHEHPISRVTNNNDGTHTGYCQTCQTNVTEKHYYYNGKCEECDDEKAYNYDCNKAGCSNKTTTPKTNSQLNASACKTSGHSDHYACTYTGCNGCFERIYCTEHDRAVTKIEGDYHYLTCVDCHDTIKVQHQGTKGYSCHDCGVHLHTDKWTHTETAHVTEPCTCGYTVSPVDFTYKQPTILSHQVYCSACRRTIETSQDHTFEGTVCTLCGYDKSCQHKNTEWVKTETTHKLVCTNKDCEDSIRYAEEPHNFVNNKCTVEGCGYVFNCSHAGVSNGEQCSCEAIIYYNNSTSSIEKGAYLSGTADKHYVIILNKDVTINTAVKLGATNSFKGTITIDLNGHTLTCNSTITYNCGKFELKNSKEEGKFVSKANIGVTPLTLDNVNIEYIGGANGFITAGSTADITIKNCNIDVSNSTKNRVVYFNSNDVANASITITGSTITCGTLVHFNNATQGNMATNTIKVNSSTVNNKPITGNSQVTDLIAGTNKDSIDITVSPAA